MRTVNYKEKDYDEIFLEMMQDAYQYGLVSTDERFLDYIKNRQDIENMYCLFLSVYAFEHSKIFEEMTKLYNSNDLEKAMGKDLDILGNKFGIPRPTSRRSSVEVTFTINRNTEADFIIPKATIVSTETGKNYYTLEEAVIIRGQVTTVVQCMSVDAGYNSRVDKDTLRICRLNGVIGTNNAKGSSGGRDAYSDEEYRKLIRNWAYSHIKGTKEAYELFFAYYDGIDGYRLVPKWDGAGTLKIIVDPSDDWILNDLSEKIEQNVQLLDDDVFITGAIKRTIDVNCNVNVDIDNAQQYSVDEREDIAIRVENAIRLFIDGGYRRNGTYYKGMGIGTDFVPFQAGIFISQEVPEIRSVDFKDTIKNIDNTILASDFTKRDNSSDICYDKVTGFLYSDDSHEFESPLLYITNAKRLISDNDGFIISFYKDGEKLDIDDKIKYQNNGKIMDLEGLDLYGCTIRLRAENKKKDANISKIVIYGTNSLDSDNSYNTHIRISDEEIGVSGEISVTVQNDYVNDYTVCY